MPLVNAAAGDCPLTDADKAAAESEAGRDVNRREAGMSGALSAATAASTSSELNEESSICAEPEFRACAFACEAAAEAEAGHEEVDWAVLAIMDGDAKCAGEMSGECA